MITYNKSFIFVLLIWPHLLQAEITRRKFFDTLKNEFIAGKLEGIRESKERRRLQREADDKIVERMRRRLVFERNIKRITDGIYHRLRKKSWGVWVIGGAVMIIWLCHRGSVGCDRDE